MWEEALLDPSDELLAVDGVVIVGRSDAVDAHLVEDERAGVVQLGEDVGWLHSFQPHQAVLRHGMHDDDALALAVSPHFVLGRGREAVPEELRAMMRVDVALVHVHDDRGAFVLLLQRLRVLVDVATNE